MRLILSPAKKMREDDVISPLSLPRFLCEAEQILAALRALTPEQRRALWGCSEAIAEENERRLSRMDLRGRLSPAILSYDGIQYQYMAPSIFEDRMLEWVQAHVRILSGLYGALCPMDGVTPYRLEMQARARVGGAKDLYAFWGDRLYEAVLPEDRTILNLASAEYSKAIERHLRPGDRFVTCVFGALSPSGRVVQKGVYVKMARGEMVRYLAERGASAPEEAQGFDRLDYRFSPEHSSDGQYVFLHA